VDEIRLHKKLYMRQAVRQAMDTFEEFAKLTLRADGEHYVVAVTDMDPDVDGDLPGELCNFALVNTIERKRRIPG